MKRKILYSLLILNLLLAGWAPSLQSAAADGPKVIQFSGYKWQVKAGASLSPGHNNWSDANAWVDSNGYLHLKITNTPQGWQCAEVVSLDHFGFGRYQFYIIGQIDRLDPNVVLGMFTYPASDNGPAGAFETDIEISRWGDANNPNGNFSVWPASDTLQPGVQTFDFSLNGAYTTQRFTWRRDQIYFQALHGHRADDRYPIQTWLYKPADPLNYIPQDPMPLHLNLWLAGGNPPAAEVELVISQFTFIPQ